MASGWCICAPAPMPNAKGVSAIIAAKAVINLGRNRTAMEYSIFWM